MREKGEAGDVRRTTPAGAARRLRLPHALLRHRGPVPGRADRGVPAAARDVADYREVQARLGLERVVVVQPSAYGTDNRCTMDAVARSSAQPRGRWWWSTRTLTRPSSASLTKEAPAASLPHAQARRPALREILEEMAARVPNRLARAARNGRELPEREAQLGACPAPW